MAPDTAASVGIAALVRGFHDALNHQAIDVHGTIAATAAWVADRLHEADPTFDIPRFVGDVLAGCPGCSYSHLPPHDKNGIRRKGLVPDGT